MYAKRVVTAMLLSLVVAGASGALYKWTDEKGRVQYSDRPPTDKDKGGVQMSNRGIVVKKLDPGLTPEQKKAKDEEAARKKLEEQQATEQRRQDNALLQSFSSVQEIDMKREREIQALEAMITNLRGQERATNERLLEERKRVESYARSKKPLPDSIKDDVTRSEAERKVLGDEITRRQKEIAATRTHYDALKKRYIELRQENPGGTPQPTASAPGAAAKK